MEGVRIAESGAVGQKASRVTPRTTPRDPKETTPRDPKETQGPPQVAKETTEVDPRRPSRPPEGANRKKHRFHRRGAKVTRTIVAFRSRSRGCKKITFFICVFLCSSSKSTISYERGECDTHEPRSMAAKVAPPGEGQQKGHPCALMLSPRRERSFCKKHGNGLGGSIGGGVV